VAGDERVFTPAGESLRLRFPWLAINLATAFVAAAVIGLFKNTVDTWTLLAVFMGVPGSMGGNAATQTLTVIVRGLALGELTWSNSRKALFKEILVGIGNGVANGLIAGLVVWVFRADPMIAVLLFVAMIINLFVAGAAGTLIPLGLKAMRADPALGSTVFITTFTDVAGLASFLGLATVYLRMGGKAG
jgi:magnesium transporter